MRVAAVVMLLTSTAFADDVLVRGDAALRVEPDGTALHVGASGYLAMHVIAKHGKQLEVEPACASILRTPGLAHVHLFVAADDLALVTTRPVHRGALNLVAGLPVTKRGDAYVVDGREVPADYVGHAYASEPCKPIAESDDATGSVIPAGTELTTPSGRAFAVAAAPIPVTLVTGAKRVCVSRELMVDDGTPATVRACAPARVVTLSARP